MDEFMNGNIRFERGLQAPDGIHDQIEVNEIEVNEKVEVKDPWPIVLMVLGLLTFCIIGMAILMWRVDV